MTSEEVRDTMLAIANWIETNKDWLWVGKDPQSKYKEYDVLSVIPMFVDLKDSYKIAVALFRKTKTNLHQWNDSPGRTKEDVARLYRLCAEDM